MELIIFILIWNVIVFTVYALDKYKAVKNKWRISEKTLLILAFLMGGIGAYLAFGLLRHKTKHLKFKILLPACAGITIAAIVYILAKYIV